MQNHQDKKTKDAPPEPKYNDPVNVSLGDGPKDAKEKVELHKKLRECFMEDGITPYLASVKCKCSYRYAVKYFKYLGTLITEAEEHDWIERNDIVRKRALEGIAVKIEDHKERLKVTRDELTETIKLKNQLTPKAIERLRRSSIKELIAHLEDDEMTDILNFFRSMVFEYTKFGFLINQQIREERSERTYGAELQQQYDSIEILPPPSEVLEAELEKRVAAKQNLYPVAIPQRQEDKK